MRRWFWVKPEDERPSCRISRKNISGRQDSKYKGPEMGLSLVCLRNNREVGVSRAEDMRGKDREEVRVQRWRQMGMVSWTVLKDSGFYPE